MERSRQLSAVSRQEERRWSSVVGRPSLVVGQTHGTNLKTLSFGRCGAIPPRMIPTTESAFIQAQKSSGFLPEQFSFS
jgi:hypothetical protein